MGCSQSTPGKVWTQQPPQQQKPVGLPNGHYQQQQVPPLVNVQSPARHPPGPFKNEKVSQEMLERYLALENEIAVAEQGSPTMVLQHKKTQIEQLDEKIGEQKDLLQELETDTNEGATMLDHMHEANKSEEADDQVRENMAKIHNQEIAKGELSKLILHRVSLQNEIEQLEGRSDNLEKLYEEQENLLNEIFGGSYGSEDENHLEAALDQQEQMRNRIVEANFKWRQAQLMIDYAYKQLEHAVKKWMEVLEVDASDLEGRYTIASETRNNLVAAAQNIQGAQRYLNNVQFPYCAPPEVETLNKATAYIFTDMQTPDRHQHALECYTVTSKRCGALLQWIHQVVTHTISRDLQEINAKVKEASMSLRSERVSLIKRKVKEVLGKDVDIAVTHINTDVVIDLNHNDIAKTEGIDPNELTLTADELAALKSLMEDEALAPPPSSEEVFGEKFEQLNKEFQEDHLRLIKLEEENKNHVAQTLEEKLAARRQRRARSKVEEKQKEAFKSD